MSRAAELFAAADALLLDFDGPVAPLIPIPANLEVANAARAPMLARGVALGDRIGATSDHLAVPCWVPIDLPAALPEVEAACDRAEAAAASTVVPTHGAHDLSARCHQIGKPVLIVSNTAAAAICYLERRLLAAYIVGVIGRLAGRP
ncbi:hypothetical protein [Promicromonospora sp. NFX87]|uniref:hypothetical protein n=1 Tax=Promicromonospora sp. NFX87 TaxID=3402691 RepID=UPI003AFB2A9E